MRRRDRILLEKIIRNINISQEFIKEISKEDFLKSELLQRASAMTAIQIGELVKNLTSEFREENPQVAWRDIAGFRDIAAHRYETIRMDDLYFAIREEFSEIKNQIEKILESDNEDE